MLLRIALIVLLLISAARLHAIDCSSSSALPNITSPDFPNDDCSFNGLSINPQNLRFGALTFGGAGGTFFSNPFVNLGSRLYVLDENVEIYDARDVDCDFDEESFFIDNQSVAFILNGDSLNAPRMITQMWILDCEINTTR